MILLCYDGSPSARRAISAARASLGHTPATVVHVWQQPRELYDLDWFAGIGAGPAPPIAELDARALERAKAIADEGLELARGAGFAAEARAEAASGRVWRTIIDVAHELGAQVIVVGARGRSTVQSVLLGSVSNAIVHHSHIPVLVVPPPDQPHPTRGAS